MKKIHVSVIFAVMFLMLIACPGASGAQEQEFLKGCYTSQELSQVRQWESSFVGKKITGANVDEVKQFLPESFYDIMKDSGRWGESWFTVAAYQQIVPSPGCMKFTKQYLGQPKIGAQGELTNWVAGFPFPFAKQGIEMVHNARSRTFGDDYKSVQSGYTIDGRLKYDMSNLTYSNYSFFSGRWDSPPVPEVPDNPKQIWRAYLMLQKEPPETRNMSIMEIQYKDQLKAYDSWMWMPAIRRVRRRSTSERQDPQGGSDYCSYDNGGWDGPVQINTYKYLGSKEVLLGRHNDKSKIVHVKGFCVCSGTQRERVKAHVVEAVNQDPNFLYSKMVWHIDPETWVILYAERYDRHGKLWKIMDQLENVSKGYQEVTVPHYNTSQTIDVQRLHATLGFNENQYGIQQDFNMFDLNSLQMQGY